MTGLLRESSYAFRSLRKTPLVSVSVVLALALGIGANTAVFSLLDAVLLRPLPYQAPEQLVLLRESAPSYGLDVIPLSLPDFLDWRGQATSFTGMAAYKLGYFNLADRGEPERLRGAIVSSNFFSLLGGKPQVGREFTFDEEREGHGHTVVLSQALWQKRYDGDPKVIGKPIELDGAVVTVAGVMPADFRFPTRVDVWLPLGPYRAEMANRVDHSDLWAVARLRPETSLEKARAEMRTVAARLQKTYPETNGKIEAGLLPLSEGLRGDARPTVLALFGATLMVLLLTCANVVSLLLMRAQARKRIFAIRLALGSSHLDLLRHFVAETAVLTLVSAALGLLLASWCIGLVPAFTTIDAFQSLEIALDGRVLLFALGLSVLIGGGLALALTMRSSSWDLKAVLQAGEIRSEDVGGRRVNRLMVVAQFAIALVLLVDAGVLALNLAKLIQPDPGFATANLLTGRISLPEKKYAAPARQSQFFQDLLRRSRALPGVESVAVVSNLPFGGGSSQSAFTIQGRAARETEPVVGELATVSPDYFRTMGVHLLAGRAFTERDRPDAPGVAIVDEITARRLWGTKSPLGARIKLNASAEASLPWLEVVGVVGHVRNDALADAAPMQIYLPFLQAPQTFMDLVTRTSGDSTAVVSGLRWAVSQVDPQQPIDKLTPMERVLADSLSRQRLAAALLAAFALLALVITALGDYAVLAYAVARRRNEIGVRMAVGARSGDILRWVLRDGLWLTVIGISLGLALCFATERWIARLLHGINPHEPWVVASAVAATVVIGLLASYLPARRAARIHPATTLRYE